MAWAAVVGSVIGGLFASSNASDQAQAANNAAQLQWEIANRVQVREDYLFDTYKTEYRECELAYKDEICNMKPYEAKTKLAARRALTEVRREMSKAESDILDCLSEYCVGAHCGLIRDARYQEASVAVSAMNAAIYAEENLKLMRDQQRHEELARMVGFGHGVYFQTSGSALASQIYGETARAAREAASRSASATGRFIAEAFNAIGQINTGSTSGSSAVNIYNQNPSSYGYAASNESVIGDYSDPYLNVPYTAPATTTGQQPGPSYYDIDYYDAGVI